MPIWNRSLALSQLVIFEGRLDEVLKGVLEIPCQLDKITSRNDNGRRI